jgi:hypothetical protein
LDEVKLVEAKLQRVEQELLDERSQHDGDMRSLLERVERNRHEEQHRHEEVARTAASLCAQYISNQA